jgi:hypothetical protein
LQASLDYRYRLRSEFKDSGGYEDLRSNEAAEGYRRQKKGLSRGRLGSSLRNQVLSPSSCLRAKVGSVREPKWAPTHRNDSGQSYSTVILHSQSFLAIDNFGYWGCMYAYEVHAHKVHAHKVHAYKVHTHKVHTIKCTPIRYIPVRHTLIRCTP